MIRWLTRTSEDEQARHAQLAQLGPEAARAYSENAVFWRELRGDRTVFPLCVTLMGLALVGGTGLGGVAATDSWPLGALLALCAATAAEMVAHPHDSIGAFRPDSEDPPRPRGHWVVLLGLLYFLPLAVMSVLSDPGRLPAVSMVLIGLGLLGFLGCWRSTRWLAGWLVAVLSPPAALILIWRTVSPTELPLTALVIVEVVGLLMVMALRPPSGFGLWPPSVLLGELAFMVLWVDVMAGPGMRDGGPHLTWGAAVAVVVAFFVVAMAEGMAGDEFAGTLLQAIPGVHLGGLCLVPASSVGSLAGHLGVATVEFALVVALLHGRWRAWRVAEFAPRVYRTAPAVVARLDRGQDIPVESVVVDV